MIIPVCSPKLLKSGPPLNTPRDLLRHTLVHIEWSRQGVTWPNWRMWMAAAGIEDFDDSKCVLFEDSSHAIQAAIEGSVVALGDFAIVADDLSSGRLIRPFELGIKVPADFAYYLVYPTEVQAVRIVAFHDWIFDEASRTGAAVAGVTGCRRGSLDEVRCYRWRSRGSAETRMIPCDTPPNAARPSRR